MEPVPETERMEEFRPTPTPAPAPVSTSASASASASSSLSASPSLSPGYPSLRLQNPSAFSNLSIELPRKPPNLRRSTDPSPTSPASPSWSATPFIPYRPRTTSPLSGAHSRSRSTTSLAPPMSRTQSMPGVNGSGHILFSPQHRPGSPSGSPSRFELQFSNLSKCMSDEVPLHHGGFHKHPRPTTTGHLLLFEHSHLRALVL
ncbi:hypothetical protein FOXG_00641 [Fusarium oxysporum f. sp. lycopersici 4287]|uniref:Uncharacterized protein n=1 Tax=Fusarium oxysporum f. sp. lycopersici (strain 4287 / CBS 123668 / FGSC 9935 / NRRL 34936) TaxID=426428 RepID=A0A0J9WGB6_FUSO4|nr:hypothetical protein FOXG_00641 [Fusarium oxysporum f. sp. lycopersici 4287]KNA94746.1 hypothetical protein FOXG_00641 [Fusarium oxysporum f. sp. lycopersici 4287]